MIKHGKYGWVDLSNIPTRGKFFDWQHAVGSIINFKYKNIESAIIIDEYCNNKYVYISIDGYVSHYLYATTSIVKGQIGVLLKQIRRGDFIYNIGDVVNDTMLIVDRFRDDTGVKTYNYKCLNDGYCGAKNERSMFLGSKCPVCMGQKVLVGYNDVATTNPSLALLFDDPQDAYRYMQGSGKYTWFRCPICGTRMRKVISNVNQFGLCCSGCSDGISYPNKVICNVLTTLCKLHRYDTLLQEFDTEHMFKWSKNITCNNVSLSGDKVYDFYIPYDSAIIIEAHGIQHFKDSFSRLGGRTYLEEVENDNIKKQIAINNGVSDDRYIVLDCSCSNIHFIKKSIMESNLPKLLNFCEDDIDWEQCDRFATNSMVVETCKVWNDGLYTVPELARNMHIGCSTVKKYIRQGIQLGIVTETPEQRRKRDKMIKIQ